MTGPDDIPEDVWEMARETGEVVFDGAVDLYETGIETVSISLAIARALLAYGQRRADEATERAAMVAAKFVDQKLVQTKFPAGSYHVTDLASAIRSSK